MVELWVQQKSDEPSILSESIKFLSANMLSDLEILNHTKTHFFIYPKDVELENVAADLLVKYVFNEPG